MSNQFSARPIDFSDSDSDRMRTLLDNLNNLKSKLHHFTVIDELGQPLGEISDLILDAGHQLNLVLSLADARSEAASVLLNGRRIKKVSVQTQSVFVDITKADTQFLPEYSPSESLSFPEASEQPSSHLSPSESFPDLSFSEESSSLESAALFSEENPTQPTAADLELAASLFATEPDASSAVDDISLAQDWELPNQNQAENVFADWNEIADSPTANFSFENASSSENLANELEHLDLQLDNDWSELGTVSETEDTSNTFELNLDLEPLTQEPQALDVSEEDLFGTEPLSFDEPANPFAEALPDLSVDATSAPAEELSNLAWADETANESSTDFPITSAEELPDLDWSDGTTNESPSDFSTASAKELPDLDWTGTATDAESPDFATASTEELGDLDWSNGTTNETPNNFTTAPAEELPDLTWSDETPEQATPDFTLESEDFSFDLPVSEAGDDSENAFLEANETEPEPFSETAELGLENLDFAVDSPLEASELGAGSYPEPFVVDERSDRWDEWDDTSQVLGLEEPVTASTAEEMAPVNPVELAFSEPDTISTLTDLDLVADNPDLGEATPTFDELIEQPLDQSTDSSLNLEPVGFQSNPLDQPSDLLNDAWDATPTEEPISLTSSDEQDNLQSELPIQEQDNLQSGPPVVHEPEGHDGWLAAAGVGAAGLAAGLANSAPTLDQEPPENLPEESVSAPAQPVEELDTMLPLLEEQLNVEYQRRKVGEVIIRKQIETRMVQVPVRYEKLVIEQVSPERKTLAEVDLSQGALDNIELTGVNEKPTVAGEFASPAVASQALEAIAKALQNRCKRVRIEIELEDGKLQEAYQEWLDQCSQL